MTGSNTSGSAGTIRIEVNGRAFMGWKSAQIVSGLDQIATQFAVSVTRSYPADSVVRIRPGDLVRVLIGDDLVCTGYVDKCPISYDGAGYTVSASGRSKAGDIVDSCVTTEIKAGNGSSGTTGWSGVKYRADGTPVKALGGASQWRLIDAKKVIATLIKPYGLSLYADDASALWVASVAVSKGTKVSEAIKKLIQQKNLIATDTESGDLRLVSGDFPERAAGVIRASADGEQTNVLSGACSFDYSRVYSRYEVYGQSKPDKAGKAVESNARAEASSQALGVRGRTLRIFESGSVLQSEVQARATFELIYRLGRAKTTTYKINGWRQESGELWKKGTLVRVFDEILGFDDWMMIGKVTFEMSDAGCTTTLEVAPRSAYSQKKSSGWDDGESVARAIGVARTDK